MKLVYALTNDNKHLSLLAPFKLQHALRYIYKFYQVQLEQNFAAAQNRINNDYGDQVTTAFSILNIRASRNFIVYKKILQLNLACENVLDLLYHEHLDIGQVPRFGRNFQIGLNFIF